MTRFVDWLVSSPRRLSTIWLDLLAKDKTSLLQVVHHKLVLWLDDPGSAAAIETHFALISSSFVSLMKSVYEQQNASKNSCFW